LYKLADSHFLRAGGDLVLTRRRRTVKM